MKLSAKSRKILEFISGGYSYEQILSLHSDFTYKDIFSAAQEALELDSPTVVSNQDRLESIKRKHANAYEPWTSEQEEMLKQMHEGGASVKAIAAALKRQPGAIDSRKRKLGLNE